MNPHSFRLQNLMLGTLRSFLMDDELVSVGEWLVRDQVLSQLDSVEATSRNESIHAEDGVAPELLMSVYEPAGRAELRDLAPEIIGLLDGALERRENDLAPAFGVGSYSAEWVLVRYSQGQHITLRADGLDGTPGCRSVCGLSVVLPADGEGGGFFADLALDWEQWDSSGRIQIPSDMRGEWLRRRESAVWTPNLSPGDAVVFGPWVLHGAAPVKRGFTLRVLGFVQERAEM